MKKCQSCKPGQKCEKCKAAKKKALQILRDMGLTSNPKKGGNWMDRLE